MVRSIRERESWASNQGRFDPPCVHKLRGRRWENMEKEREKRGRIFANHRQCCCCCTSSLTVLDLILFLSISIDKKKTYFDCHFDMTKVAGLAIADKSGLTR
jgi:hypothetical protein